MTKIGLVERNFQDIKFSRRKLVATVVPDPNNAAIGLVVETPADGFRCYDDGTGVPFVDHRVTGLRMLGLDENQVNTLAHEAKKRTKV